MFMLPFVLVFPFHFSKSRHSIFLESMSNRQKFSGRYVECTGLCGSSRNGGKSEKMSSMSYTLKLNVSRNRISDCAINIWVVSGLSCAIYSICCLGDAIILESNTMETTWPTND